MKNWNKTGKIKALFILMINLLTLSILNFNENTELGNDFYEGIFSVMFCLIIILFLPLMAKFWSLFGVLFEKPNWNENPLSLNFSKSLNFFQFIAYWFISSGIITVLFVGIFYQQFHVDSAHLFFVGVSLIIGIKLSLKWLNKSRNEKEKTVANNMYN